MEKKFTNDLKNVLFTISLIIIFLGITVEKSNACEIHSECSQACNDLARKYGYKECPEGVLGCVVGECCIGQCNYRETHECFCAKTTYIDIYGSVCPANFTCGDDCKCHPIEEIQIPACKEDEVYNPEIKECIKKGVECTQDKECLEIYKNESVVCSGITYAGNVTGRCCLKGEIWNGTHCEKQTKKEVFVFLDKNFNGKYDEGEEGIDGIKVIFKYTDEKKALIETYTHLGKASIEIKESDLPREGETELIVDLGKDFWPTDYGAEFVTSFHIFPNYNIYEERFFLSRKSLFNSDERFEFPLQIWEKKTLDYLLNRDAFSFGDWSDFLSGGYCCGITITNYLLFEKFYKSKKDPYHLEKSDIIQTKIVSPEGRTGEGKKEKIEVNTHLEDVIRGHQLSTCLFKVAGKAIPTTIEALIGGEEKIKEINRENVEKFKEEIIKGNPVAVYYLVLQLGKTNHAVLGVGYANLKDYFIGLIYENTQPYTEKEGLHLDGVSFMTNKEGELISLDEKANGFKVVLVDTLDDLKDPEIEETIKQSLTSINNETAKELMAKNLSIVVISGNFTLLDENCYYLVPDSKNLALCLIKPKEKIRMDAKNALIVTALPLSNLTLNITSNSLKEGEFLIESNGKIEKMNYFYLWGIMIIVIACVMVVFFLYLIKKFHKNEGETKNI
jgi:hypothetical protein